MALSGTVLANTIIAAVDTAGVLEKAQKDAIIAMSNAIVNHIKGATVTQSTLSCIAIPPGGGPVTLVSGSSTIS